MINPPGAMPPLPEPDHSAAILDSAFRPYFSADQMQAYAAPLIARVAELQADAERYRWLRAPDTDVSLVLDKVVGYEPIGPGGTGGYNLYEYRAGDELDSAIDAAIAAKD